jgi:predicted amidophosphoribosyltransferase
MEIPKGKVTKCPYCLEDIKPGALVCKHCHSPLKVPKKRKTIPAWRSNFMFGFYAGIAIMILLVILYNKIF